jgi:hypothetical protein
LFLLHLGNYFNYCLDIKIQTNYAYFAGGKLRTELSTISSTDDHSIQHPDRFLPDCSACTLDQAHQTGDGEQDRRRFLILFEYHVRQSHNHPHGAYRAMVAALVRTVAAHKLNDVGDYTCKSTSVIICQPTGYSLTDRPDELTPFVTWVSVELNVVLTVTSLPLLRPLAQEARHLFAKTREPKEQWDDTISLRSIHTSGVEDEERKTGAGVGVIALGTPSGQEGFVAQQDMSQVVRTVEVQISYEKNETPMIHACLVGLVQGQAMERLAGR